MAIIEASKKKNPFCLVNLWYVIHRQNLVNIQVHVSLKKKAFHVIHDIENRSKILHMHQVNIR